jgi:hypothetical protein
MKACAKGTSVCLKVYKNQSVSSVHRELMALYRLSDPEEENFSAQLVGYNLTQTPYFLVMHSAGGASPRCMLLFHHPPVHDAAAAATAGEVPG